MILHPSHGHFELMENLHAIKHDLILYLYNTYYTISSVHVEFRVSSLSAGFGPLLSVQ